ncbi:unnamed protein product [Vicia faba]|uniref:PRA1 family protein n=1 Tax=Vicia faba TaxID=3906 RepID=A0AAV1B668_VICFA|nr:unnamed protein product [Vicia faba]
MAKVEDEPTSSIQQQQQQPSSYILLLNIMSKRRTWACLFFLVYGTVFGLLSMVAALVVMVPAVLVTWITVVVLLAFFGKPRRVLVVEGRKITGEIFSFVVKILLTEGNVVAAVCAVLGYFVLVRRNSE